MKCPELSVHQEWRYTVIAPGDKRPILPNWQNTPLTLEDIPACPRECNVGLLLGEVSGGIVAIDFDGEEAWQHWEQTFGPSVRMEDSVCWSSGKDWRMQVLYRVPAEMHPFLKKKVINKLEFRWTGGQSVLPPSKLDDGRRYKWIRSPSDTVLRELPVDVLEYWYGLCKDPVAPKTPLVCVDDLNGFLLTRLNAIGCVYRNGSATMNLWHSGEQSKGGWFIYKSNPLWVNHNGQKAMKLDAWLDTYWCASGGGNIFKEYREGLQQQLNQAKARMEKTKKGN